MRAILLGQNVKREPDPNWNKEIVYLTTTQTWTVPNHVHKIDVWVLGGGSLVKSRRYYTSSGNDVQITGQGGCFDCDTFEVEPGQQFLVTIGGVEGTTTFGTLLTGIGAGHGGRNADEYIAVWGYGSNMYRLGGNGQIKMPTAHHYCHLDYKTYGGEGGIFLGRRASASNPLDVTYYCEETELKGQATAVFPETWYRNLDNQNVPPNPTSRWREVTFTMPEGGLQLQPAYGTGQWCSQYTDEVTNWSPTVRNFYETIFQATSGVAIVRYERW